MVKRYDTCLRRHPPSCPPQLPAMPSGDRCTSLAPTTRTVKLDCPAHGQNSSFAIPEYLRKVPHKEVCPHGWRKLGLLSSGKFVFTLVVQLAMGQVNKAPFITLGQAMSPNTSWPTRKRSKDQHVQGQPAARAGHGTPKGVAIQLHNIASTYVHALGIWACEHAVSLSVEITGHQ